MTVRLALTLSERDERSISVAAAAERLGCDQTTIHELLRKGLLSGVRIGKTENPSGIRVKLWSIQDWEPRPLRARDLEFQSLRRRRQADEGHHG